MCDRLSSVEVGADVQVVRCSGPEAARSAAGIWARAKAIRDGETSDVAVDQALASVERRLGLDGARLLTAARGGRAAGFVLFAPVAAQVELFYLAVDPDFWGAGVAGALLRSLDQEARGLGLDALTLWVIDDNQRAISVYERCGWVRTEQTQRESPRSRLERRFVKQLEPAP